MALKRRIVASDRAAAGRKVVVDDEVLASEVPGAVLSAGRLSSLRAELREVDESQHAALASGDRYYLGTQLHSR
jgi:hypothetical protein